MSLSRVNAQVCNDWQLDEIARLTNGRKVGRFIRIAPGNRRHRRPRIFLELQLYAQDDRQNLGLSLPYRRPPGDPVNAALSFSAF